MVPQSQQIDHTMFDITLHKGDGVYFIVANRNKSLGNMVAICGFSRNNSIIMFDMTLCKSDGVIF